MELEVLSISGKKTSKKVKLDEAIFGIEPNDHAIYLDVKQYLANQRQGTHKAKERAEITGSTRKIKKQKGTGTARAGSIKSGVFVGGGRIFGPRPRNYSFKLNIKLKRLARKSALTYKAKNDEILVIDSINFDVPKTKDFVSAMNNLKVSDKKTLVVLPEANANVSLSARNIQKANIVVAENLNTYDILNANKLIFVEGSLDKLNALFNN